MAEICALKLTRKVNKFETKTQSVFLSQRFQHDQSTNGQLPANKFNESPEYTIVVKHIPSTVTRQAILDFASRFGTLAVEPHITQSSRMFRMNVFDCCSQD